MSTLDRSAVLLGRRIHERRRARGHTLEFVGHNLQLGDFFEHAEDEFLTVVEGALVVDLGDGVVHELGPRDSLYCVGGTPHRWRSASTAPYRLFLVKENPRRP